VFLLQQAPSQCCQPVRLFVARRVRGFKSLNPPVLQQPPQRPVQRAGAETHAPAAESFDILQEGVAMARLLRQTGDNKKHRLGNRCLDDMSHDDILKQNPTRVKGVSFGEAFRFWLKLGFISFGGPAGQIAIMHRELVVRRRWLSEDRFFYALNYCMLLPGPEAQQLATYIGWLMHNIKGGLVAGGLFVLPSAFILLGLSYVYAAHGHVPAIAGILTGL